MCGKSYQAVFDDGHAEEIQFIDDDGDAVGDLYGVDFNLPAEEEAKKVGVDITTLKPGTLLLDEDFEGAVVMVTKKFDHSSGNLEAVMFLDYAPHVRRWTYDADEGQYLTQIAKAEGVAETLLKAVTEKDTGPEAVEVAKSLDYATILGLLVNDAVEIRKNNGFETPNGITQDHHAEQMLGKLMLVSTEITEFQQEVEYYGFTLNSLEELADIAIRTMDILGSSVDMAESGGLASVYARRYTGDDVLLDENSVNQYRQLYSYRDSRKQAADLQKRLTIAAEYTRDQDPGQFYASLVDLLRETEKVFLEAGHGYEGLNGPMTLWDAVRGKNEKNRGREPLHGRQISL